MKKNIFIISILFLATTIYADSVVYLTNLTPWKLNLSYKKTLADEYVAHKGPNHINPGQKELKLWSFNRDTGVKKDKTYYFDAHVTYRGPGPSTGKKQASFETMRFSIPRTHLFSFDIVLKQKLLGETFNSHMWQGLEGVKPKFGVTWFDDRKEHYKPVVIDNVIIPITYTAKFTGGFDDVYYTIGPVTSYNMSTKKLGDLRVMSFNVRYENDRDTGYRHWSQRLPKVIKMIQNFKPDIIGLQEAKKGQIEDLEDALPGYKWFGKMRYTSIFKDQEYNPIFYNIKTMFLKKQGTYGLSEGLEIGKKVGDALDPRILTFGTFMDLKSRRNVTYINTHLDHLSGEVRKKQIGYLIQFLKNIHKKLPNEIIFIGGDFNAKATDVSIQELLKRNFKNTQNVAQKKSNINATFVGFNNHLKPATENAKNKGTIDHILYSGKGNIKQHGIIQQIQDGKEIIMSDHRPVLVDVQP